MTSRGKRNFPFKRETKPVVNEPIQFDDFDGAVGTKKGSSRAVVGSSTGGNNTIKARHSLSKGVAAAATPTASLEMSNDKTLQKSKAPSSAAMKRRMTRANDSEDDAEGQADANTQSILKKHPKLNYTDSKKSAHYPSCEYIAKLREVDANSEHNTVLATAVGDICAAEVATLENYFSTELPGARHNAILIHLLDVLRELPGLVKDRCPIDIEFLPEMAKTERVKLSADQSKLQAMNAVLETLRKYADDTDQFLSDSGLLEVSDTGTKSGKKLKVSKKAENFASEFEEKLNHMDAMMDQILRAVDSASAVSRTARDSQQKLFDNHQKSKRLDTFSGLGGASISDQGAPTTRSARTGNSDIDPKVLLKTMQNRY